MLVSLSRTYHCRRGAPAISQVDLAIFQLQYFMHCMDCSFCHDSCCQYGADIELPMMMAIQSLSAELVETVSVPATQWFQSRIDHDSEYPSGQYSRTVVVDNRCVFLNRSGRGCLLHQYSLSAGTDFRELKPLVCCLFPISFHQGVFQPALEVSDGSLICAGDGPTVYQSARSDIEYFFGPELVRELDHLQQLCTQPSDCSVMAKEPSLSIALPLVQPT